MSHELWVLTLIIILVASSFLVGYIWSTITSKDLPAEFPSPPIKR